MKATIKAGFLSLIAVAALAACGGAHAAPALVKDVSGAPLRATESAKYVEKTNDGTNRVAVRYSSGVQYMSDLASYAKIVNSFGSLAVAVPGSATQRVYNMATSNGVYCSGGQTIVSFPDVGSADYLGDGCQTYNAANAIAQ